MEQEKNVHKHLNIGQLPRFSRSIRIYLQNDDTEYMEPINMWSYNLSIIKENKEKEEKLIQK